MAKYDLEIFLDDLAEKLIDTWYINANPEYVRQNRKTVKNGIISIGRENAEKLILYEKDIKANKEDLNIAGVGEVIGFTLQEIIDLFDEIPSAVVGTGNNSNQLGTESVYAEGYINQAATSYEITNIITDHDNNPLNISQFINVGQTRTQVDSTLANEFLDTTIFELIPGATTRQERIDNFFAEWEVLKGIIPDFDTDGVADEVGTEVQPDFDAVIHSHMNDIIYNPIEGNIVRRDEDASTSGTNIGKTLQSLRDTLNEYLKDIDFEVDGFGDERPTYHNKSNGYLKFRHLNQGIIIRNTDAQYVEGLNPTTQNYLTTGFTISMWVRFLDKKSEGTLFNFGNPFRDNDSSRSGFKLETIVGNTEQRFIRFVVWDSTVTSYFDSHTGTEYFSKILASDDKDYIGTVNPTQYIEVPIDFTEWYFICATYNPEVTEPTTMSAWDNYSTCTPLCSYDPLYWLNHIDANGFTAFSSEGNRAKVELISRSDLLRARGYKG